MILSDKDLKKIFPDGASIVDRDDEDATPVRGRLEPHEENPEWMNLWVNDGANTVLLREVEPVMDHYEVHHNGRPFVLVALREKGLV